MCTYYIHHSLPCDVLLCFVECGCGFDIKSFIFVSFSLLQTLTLVQGMDTAWLYAYAIPGVPTPWCLYPGTLYNSISATQGSSGGDVSGMSGNDDTGGDDDEWSRANGLWWWERRDAACGIWIDRDQANGLEASPKLWMASNGGMESIVQLHLQHFPAHHLQSYLPWRGYWSFAIILIIGT